MSWLMTSDFFFGGNLSNGVFFFKMGKFGFILGFEVAKIRPKKFNFLFKLPNATLSSYWL